MTSLTTRSTPVQEMDRTEAIKIASWTILGITVVVFIARQIMKTIVFRRVALDDFFILLATVSNLTTLHLKLLISQGVRDRPLSHDFHSCI